MSLDFKQPRIFWVCCSWGPVQTLHLLHSTLSAGQPRHRKAVQRQPHHLRHFQQGLEHVRQYFSGDGGEGGGECFGANFKFCYFRHLSKVFEFLSVIIRYWDFKLCVQYLEASPIISVYFRKDHAVITTSPFLLLELSVPRTQQDINFRVMEVSEQYGMNITFEVQKQSMRHPDKFFSCSLVECHFNGECLVQATPDGREVSSMECQCSHPVDDSSSSRY